MVNYLAETSTGGWAGDVPTSGQVLRGSAAEPPNNVDPDDYGNVTGHSSHGGCVDVHAVRKLLREVDISSEMVNGASWVDLCGRLQWRHNF